MLTRTPFGEYCMPGFRLDQSALNYRVVGIVNGVICLSNDVFTCWYGMFLWNPSIYKLVKLPPARVTYHSHGPYMHTIGFGIDPLTQDFKIVRVVYLDCEVIPAEVDVYSLSSGRWRNISARVGLKNFIDERASQAYLNGVLHWVGCAGWGKRNLIVSFDIGNDVFGKLELPIALATKWSYTCGASASLCRNIVCAFVYQQHSLALLETKGHVTGCSIWVMRDYRMTESWTTLYNINFNEGPAKTEMFTENGEFAFEIDDNGNLVSKSNDPSALGRLLTGGTNFNHNEVFKRIAGFKKNGEFLLETERGYLMSYDPHFKRIQDLRIPCSTNFCWKNMFANSYTESAGLLSVTSNSCAKNLALLGDGSLGKDAKKGGKGKEAKKGRKGVKKCSTPVASEKSNGEGTKGKEVNKKGGKGGKNSTRKRIRVKLYHLKLLLSYISSMQGGFLYKIQHKCFHCSRWVGSLN